MMIMAMAMALMTMVIDATFTSMIMMLTTVMTVMMI